MCNHVGMSFYVPWHVPNLMKMGSITYLHLKSKNMKESHEKKENTLEKHFGKTWHSTKLIGGSLTTDHDWSLPITPLQHCSKEHALTVDMVPYYRIAVTGLWTSELLTGNESNWSEDSGNDNIIQSWKSPSRGISWHPITAVMSRCVEAGVCSKSLFRNLIN